jgi:phosphoglucomutase
LGNDPDADRLAVAEKVRNVNGDDEWKIFSGNEIAALLADWTWQNFKKKNPNADFSKCCMIASTVSSKFLQAMAKAEGFSFFDTLTGFKWMGNTALSLENDGYTLLFAYEVEIGFLVGNLSYDKDGIRTSAIFAEMSDYHYRNGRTLSQHLQDLRKRYGYFEMNASYFFCHSKPNMDRLFESLRNHPESYPKSLGEYTISSVRDVTKGLDSQQANGLSILPRMPKDHVNFFLQKPSNSFLDDYISIHQRLCGYHPKFRNRAKSEILRGMPKQKRSKRSAQFTHSIVCITNQRMAASIRIRINFLIQQINKYI